MTELMSTNDGANNARLKRLTALNKTRRLRDSADLNQLAGTEEMSSRFAISVFSAKANQPDPRQLTGFCFL